MRRRGNAVRRRRGRSRTARLFVEEPCPRAIRESPLQIMSVPHRRGRRPRRPTLSDLVPCPRDVRRPSPTGHLLIARRYCIPQSVRCASRQPPLGKGALSLSIPVPGPSLTIGSDALGGPECPTLCHVRGTGKPVPYGASPKRSALGAAPSPRFVIPNRMSGRNFYIFPVF